MLISVAEQANEEIRLRHRYLDLRRPILTANIKKRSDVAQIVRSVFHKEGMFRYCVNGGLWYQ